jgi:GT2 family glycosyltransferase
MPMTSALPGEFCRSAFRGCFDGPALSTGRKSVIAISIVIVNRNTRELLRACLDSIRKDDSVQDREVIVVDNASTDGSKEMLREQYPEVRVLWNNTNEGFAKPNNDGMNISTGRYLFLLNSDTEIARGTLGAMVDFMDKNPHAGACGPRLIYADGRLQRSVSKAHTPLTHLFDMLFLDTLFSRSYFFGGGEMTTCPYDPDRVQPVPSLMGAAVVTRREAVLQTGMFDEELSIYYNEMDWFMRMHNDGWTVHYVPTTTVIHHRGATTAVANKGFEQLNEMYYNVFWFFRKHYGVAGLLEYRLLLIIGFLPRFALWTLRRILRDSAQARYMQTYSWKVFCLGLQWWSRIERLKPGARQA